MTPFSVTAAGLGRLLAVGLFEALVATGCGGGAPAQSAPSAAPHGESTTSPTAGALAKPANAAIRPREPEPGQAPPPAYKAQGRRDAFLPVPVPVPVVRERAEPSVTSFKLVGVVQGGVFLALVESPDGTGYILSPGDVLADGRITDITPSSVTFAVSAKNGRSATTVTLRLDGD